VGGQREEYQPVRSELFPNADPAAVAQVLVERFQATWVYVADLDAIQGKLPDWHSLTGVANSGLLLMLDAGVGDLDAAQAVARATVAGHQVDAVIVALECLRDPSDLSAVVQTIGQQRAVFSLDLFNGQPMGKCTSLTTRGPLEIADLAWDAGFRRLIVLDLAAVGKGQGPSTVELCRSLTARHVWPQLISGGGVRGEQDLLALSRAGCDTALVASSLYLGSNEGRKELQEDNNDSRL
jgi:phosphoribosylformimino-5-aminoimidazole carboxamide ribotide isomerase